MTSICSDYSGHFAVASFIEFLFNIYTKQEFNINW